MLYYSKVRNHNDVTAKVNVTLYVFIVLKVGKYLIYAVKMANNGYNINGQVALNKSLNYVAVHGSVLGSKILADLNDGLDFFDSASVVKSVRKHAIKIKKRGIILILQSVLCIVGAKNHLSKGLNHRGSNTPFKDSITRIFFRLYQRRDQIRNKSLLKRSG